jgi:hypothetical protein
MLFEKCTVLLLLFSSITRQKLIYSATSEEKCTFAKTLGRRAELFEKRGYQDLL